MNLAASLPPVVELLVKSAAILVAAALMDRAWPRASAAQRHLVWLAAFIVLLFLPATRLAAPRWNLASMPHTAVSVRGSVLLASGGESASAPIAAVVGPMPSLQVNWPALAMDLWLAGSALLLARRAVGGVRLRLMLRTSAAADAAQQDHARRIAAEFGVTRPITLRVSRGCRVPLTWGIWRPVLMLPVDAAAWPDDQLRAALRHECAHIRRGDFAVRLLADFVRACYWPNPLVWFANRALRTAQEQACDDLVLHAGTCPADYATLLCEAARRFAAPPGAVAMAQPSTLESRVLAIVDATRDRRPLTLRAACFGALSIAFTLVLCTAAQVRAADPAPVVAPARGDVPQVLIEAKFVEIASGKKDADALLASLGHGSQSGRKSLDGVRLLTGTAPQNIVKALTKTKGVNLLSSPRVITNSKQQATIEIVRKFDYPTDWKKDTATGRWRVTARAMKNTGITLEAEPVVRTDGKITLQIKPQVVEFLGFKNLDTGEFPASHKLIAVIDGKLVGDNKRLMPLFSERTLDTTVVLQNAGTVVLGGLREVGSIKLNAGAQPASELLVFITASIVKPNGEPTPADK